MPRVGTLTPVRFEQRLCLSCGYRGRDLQGARGRKTFRCPCCAEDLYARPPRSYAEMEGLGSEVVEVAPKLEANPRPALPVARLRSAPRLSFWLRVERFLIGALAGVIVLGAAATVALL